MALRSLVAIVIGFAVSAGAIEITPPSAGDLEVEITGYTVPANLSGTTKNIPRQKGWVTLIWVKYVDDGSQAWIQHISPSDNRLLVALNGALSGADVLIAIDNWTGEITTTKVPGKSGKTDDFLVEGFTPGSSETRILGIPPGSQLRSVCTTPGAWPTETVLVDGSWGDQDNEVNGEIVAGPPRFGGPGYVLPGEIWTLALEGDGVFPTSVSVVAEGPMVRHVVSVVSHVIGASGMPFISDLTLTNPTGLEISGWVRFIEDGSSLDIAPSVDFQLGPGQLVSWEDVLQSAFNVTANVKGSLVVGGYPHWLLQVSSRNYAVDAEGRRFGIAVPGQATLVPVTGQNPWILPGLQAGEGFRTNLFLAGLAATTSEVSIQLVSDGAVVASATYSVPAYELVQVNRVVAALGASEVEQGHLELLVSEGGIAAALSVVDGTADDAAFVSARPMFP